MIGQSIAHYRIIAKLGEGGMGEVYRAADIKLDREVALKILPPAFASESDRMARFEREAKVLASLNHPNIAAIYGVEERALVMELVEGASPKGPMPFDDAWKIALQIAAALEYAHDKGIVHRDLKPDNIKITPDGVVKLLDFGLAKAFTEQKELSANPEHSPTLTIGATEVGVILGTAAYMAPEQAKGKSVDKRADIWAFGVVLYELLTGERLFKGEDAADTLAQVLTKEPSFDRVAVEGRRLLRRCLEKDPKQRLRDIGDACELLKSVEAPAAAVRSKRPWLAATLIVVAAAGWFVAWRATRAVEHPLTRLSVDLGPEAVTGLNTTVAISPDGRRLVYPARGGDGRQQLATRMLDQPVPTLLPDTDGGSDPFFSPNSEWVGFFAGGRLKKISVHGAAVTLCVINRPDGGTWGKDDNIVAPVGNLSPLSRVSAAGGAPQDVTKLSAGEITHRWPQALPGGETILFTASPANIGQENANLEVLSLKTGQVKVVQRGAYYGRYVPTGHLLYVHQGVLFAVGFDLAKLETRGTPTPLVEDLGANSSSGGGQFDVSGAASEPGTLVYLAGKAPAQAWQISWLDSSGKVQPLIAGPGGYTLPRISPDGRKLAFENGGDIYIYDTERETTMRLTFTGATGEVWAPDGRHLAFRTKSGLSWIRSDGAGEPQRLLEGSTWIPWSFSPDGRRLAYFESITGSALWTLPLDLSDPEHPKAGKADLFLRTPADQRAPSFSPDGRWIAYRSNEPGNTEVYVRPFPAGSGGKWQISTGGGLFPIWSKNERKLFYEALDNRIMVVDYAVNGDSFTPGKPRLWSETQIFFPGALNMDLAPDSKRFAVLTMPEGAVPGQKASVHVTMLLNFFDELRRRIPAK